MTAAATLLSVEGLGYSFARDRPPLFRDLSFDVREGEFVSLLAPSGLGKTTLFRLIAGLLPPERGVIRIGGGTPPNSPAPANPARRRKASPVGYMPQRDALMPWRTVLDNAALGLEMSGVPKREARARVRELLPEFGLDGTADRMPHELSGGMRQRVAFLRCLLGGGELLLLDEPFGALDAMTRIAMQQWLLGIWEKRRTTVLFITHDVDEALLLSDRLLLALSSPVAELTEVRVDRPRPRAYADLLRPDYIALKERVLTLLHSHLQR